MINRFTQVLPSKIIGFLQRLRQLYILLSFSFRTYCLNRFLLWTIVVELRIMIFVTFWKSWFILWFTSFKSSFKFWFLDLWIVYIWIDNWSIQWQFNAFNDFHSSNTCICIRRKKHLHQIFITLFKVHQFQFYKMDTVLEYKNNVY